MEKGVTVDWNSDTEYSPVAASAEHSNESSGATNGREFEDGCPLGYSTVYSGIYLPKFQRSLLPPSSGFTTLIMEVISSSETSVNIYQTTWCCIPEDSHLHTCGRENHKSHRQQFTDQPSNYQFLKNDCVP
jgi:hypothetical protein